MKKKQFQLPSFQMKRRLFLKRKPSAHAQKWLTTYFVEDQKLNQRSASQVKSAE